VRLVKGTKNEFVTVHVMKTYGENRGTAPVILSRSVRLRFVGNFMPERLYTRKTTHRTKIWVNNLAGMDRFGEETKLLLLKKGN
jgi:hypothetical protein